MLNETNTGYRDYMKSVNHQLTNEKVEYDFNGKWGIQILVIEIRNQNDLNIVPLVKFLNSSFKDIPMMETIFMDFTTRRMSIEVYEPWSENEKGNFECKLIFEGSLKGVETRLLNHPWFKNVDMDFFFDTRRKIGHSSYRWFRDEQISCQTNCVGRYQRNVNYFISKDLLSVTNLFGYDVFSKFILEPESFPDQKRGLFVTKVDSDDGDFGDETKIFEYLIHDPEYSVSEFEESFSKLVQLNFSVRPKINQSKGLVTYHNCIKDWVQCLSQILWSEKYL